MAQREARRPGQHVLLLTAFKNVTGWPVVWPVGQQLMYCSSKNDTTHFQNVQAHTHSPKTARYHRRLALQAESFCNPPNYDNVTSTRLQYGRVQSAHPQAHATISRQVPRKAADDAGAHSTSG
jgi:hypothetical protein